MTRCPPAVPGTVELSVPGAPADVRVVLARVAPLTGWAESVRDCLDDDERARAAALRSPADRRRFVVAHCVLRHVLAARTGADPGALRLGPPRPVRGPRPKPRLEDHALRFSLSHSGSRILVATAEREVGVDVEGLQDPVAAEQVLPLLHPAEIAAVRNLPAADRPAAVTTVWARKESLLKAMGSGLFRDPAVDEVGAGPVPEHPVAGWRILDVPLPPDPGPAPSNARAALTVHVPSDRS
ncbi:4'-phosphopantetheinyl transferase superfamily protein [Kocuria sp. CPCC 205268]|uniref:4'-phosphopantetheinyl transferase family protein n=1 Tax=Kocuria oxytropis TaxID=3058913 RepID=UPI0034D74D0B